MSTLGELADAIFSFVKDHERDLYGADLSTPAKFASWLQFMGNELRWFHDEAKRCLDAIASRAEERELRRNPSARILVLPNIQLAQKNLNYVDQGIKDDSKFYKMIPKLIEGRSGEIMRKDWKLRDLYSEVQDGRIKMLASLGEINTVIGAMVAEVGRSWKC